VRFASPKVRPPVLIVAVVGVLFIALVAVPRARRGAPAVLPPNPAEEAARLYDSFIEKATANSIGGLKTGSPGEESERRLPRDLFRPQAVVAPPVYAPWDLPPSDSPGDSLTPAPVPRAQPLLEGIFIDGRTAYAVINGRVVAEGDSVAGGWVIQIRRDGVTWLSPRQAYVRLDWRLVP
jgi:hypothetical protein